MESEVSSPKEKPSLIVLASDYVGYNVVRFLIDRGEHIDFLIVDERDIGGYNRQIEQAYHSSHYQMAFSTDSVLKNSRFLDCLFACEPRLGISAWWPNILKGRILDVPELGWLNFHPSYLPYNRGKYPNFWSIADQTPCGVTLHFINKDIDAGEIVAQKEIQIDWEDTGGTLYNKAREEILDLFRKNYGRIVSNNITRTKVEKQQGTFHLGKDLEPASRIDLNKIYTARQLLNLIRARMFYPGSTATFEDGGEEFSVEVKIKRTH